jgi:hypothetical protein
VGTCNGVASAPPPADLICQWLTLRYRKALAELQPSKWLKVALNVARRARRVCPRWVHR